EDLESQTASCLKQLAEEELSQQEDSIFAGKKPKPLLECSLVVCEVDESLKEKLKKFRFRKETNNAAILSEYDFIENMFLSSPIVICFT
ncbi:unnamed protein product, partial [Coregonus sp. 'balchen']